MLAFADDVMLWSYVEYQDPSTRTDSLSTARAASTFKWGGFPCSTGLSR